MYTLRDYQVQAHKAIFNEWNKGHRKTVVSLATGLGKTIIFASVIHDAIQDNSRAMVLAHREELLEQAKDKLKISFGIESALEKAEYSSIGCPELVTVASVQSMAQDKRLERFPQDYFKTIVIDEAHHVLSESYKKVLSHFPGANVLGVTATIDRGDRQDLSKYFDSLAFEYSIKRGVKNGYLSPIKAEMIPLKLDISNVNISNGDYAVGELGKALDPYLDQIADEMVKYCKGRRTVVFLPLIATSQKFCEILNRVGLRAAEVHGTSPDRAEILTKFERGEYDVLCNAMLLTEGWDCPSVDCIVVLRPTKIRSLYVQAVGRGTRLSPETGKKDLLLLDFLWSSKKHDLCRPAVLVSASDDIANKVTNAIVESEAEQDLIQLSEGAEKDILEEREQAVAKELHKMRHKKREQVDPLQFSLSIESETLTNYKPAFDWEMKPPSEAQISLLEKYKIYTGDVDNAGMASALINELVTRSKLGLSTPKQIRLLERYGFKNVGTWSTEHATKIIGRIQANGWKLPYWFDASSYVPEYIKRQREMVANG